MFFIGEIMNIGILNESDSIEKRVAIVPETVKTLTKNGHNFFSNQVVGKMQVFQMKNIWIQAVKF